VKDKHQEFREECAERVASYQGSKLERAAAQFMRESTVPKYSYNFTWLSRPIIQYPQDMVAVQQIIWQVKPDLVIETGIAHGGSLIFSASLLCLLDYCEAATAGETVDPRTARRRVLGIDIDIRAHNREAIQAHPMAHRIDMIEGSSIDPGIVAQVHRAAQGHERVLVLLDSNHTHDHVLAELEAYAPLVTPQSYCCVFDTVIEDLPDGMYPDRPWSRGNNPKTAVREYLRRLGDEGRHARDGGRLMLEIDENLDLSLLISVAPQGYLKRA
jgi:cephalosporin hydroxylase